MKVLFLIVLIVFGMHFSHAQVTLILQPGAADGKDNQVYNNLPNTNYVSDLLRGEAWTFQGDPGIIRAFFKFDLSSIPLGSTIDSAYLFLYAPNAPTNEFQSGDNAAYLRRITNDWAETTITWNNQPSYSTLNQVLLPMSTSQFQNYEHIDVGNLLTDMIHNPGSAFGFILMQQIETPLRRMSFCSSDYPDDAKHPKLIVHYTPPACTNVVLRQDGTGQDNQVFSLQPSSNYVSDLLRSMSWTFQGSSGKMRSLLQFDLSSIPANSEIVYASLSLFSPDAPTTEVHSGSNEAYIQRITDDWNESTVTWNNQPSTTTLHQVSLPASTSEYQDYLNINVTSLVEDMSANPATSFGFLLRQQTEEGLRRLSFVSGDYPNVQKHPVLEVCYNPPTAVEEINKYNIKIYPNPAQDFVQIDFDKDLNDAQVYILDVLGHDVLKKQINASSQIDISEFLPSVYFIRIVSSTNEVLAVAKIVKH